MFHLPIYYTYYIEGEVYNYLILVYGYILLEFNFLIVLVLCNLENNKWNFFYIIILKKKNNVKNREFLYLPAQCNLETQKDIIYFLRSQPSTRIQKEFPLYFTLVPAFCWLSSLTYAYLRCSLWPNSPVFIYRSVMTLRIFTTRYIFLHSILLQNCVKKWRKNKS